MSRLFITPRELAFIADLTREITKDVIGQVIYYYPVSELKTVPHEVYNESVKKITDSPISIDALVSAQYQTDTVVNAFGIDQQYKIEVFIQYRDLVEKGINVSIGDFFSHGSIFYEIAESVITRAIYGFPEHQEGVKLTGVLARAGQFEAVLRGPTDTMFSDDDAVQKKFEQQRGFLENDAGPTGDVRELVENGTLDEPLSSPREVSEAGVGASGPTNGSAFYDE